MLFDNPRAARSAYPAELQAIMSIDKAHQSRSWLSHWSGISPGATPLYSLPGLAAQLGVARLSVKDESVRSPLGSFKALGAPIALVRQILRLHPDLEPTAILTGRYFELLRDYTVVSATDGNHGRGLAAAAASAGCKCVIVLHANVSIEREQAIAEHGASIVRITGNYDESVEEAARLARDKHWQVVSDTSYEGYEDIPRDVMQGYGTIMAEIAEQTAEEHARPFTHLFIQGGVGGLAAGLISYQWEQDGPNRPRFIVVEPRQADCLLQSAMAGRPSRATGSVDSVMAGLACGEASPLAWRFLETSVDHFMTIADDAAIEAMRTLVQGGERDIPVVAGESGVAGLAALAALHDHPAEARRVGLGLDSRVLIVNTEGATAPEAYSRLVGESPAATLKRQANWRLAAMAA